MTIIWTTRCLEWRCGWGDESESYEVVCAAAQRHETDHAGHQTHLRGRYEWRQKKPCPAPELIEYGIVRRLMAGAGGSMFDSGHTTRISVETDNHNDRATEIAEIASKLTVFKVKLQNCLKIAIRLIHPVRV